MKLNELKESKLPQNVSLTKSGSGVNILMYTPPGSTVDMGTRLGALWRNQESGKWTTEMGGWDDKNIEIDGTYKNKNDAAAALARAASKKIQQLRAAE